jgi:uncharacterized cupredoxin-like copper-binding protein
VTRPRTLQTLALASLAAALPANAIAAAHAETAKKAPTHLLVDAQEWSLWPSTTNLRAGTIDVELWNRGQDVHDLQIRRLNAQRQMVGPVDGSVKQTRSGAISQAVWHLKAGRYEIYCSMPGHLQLGMHANLTVKRS